MNIKHSHRRWHFLLSSWLCPIVWKPCRDYLGYGIRSHNAMYVNHKFCHAANIGLLEVQRGHSGFRRKKKPWASRIRALGPPLHPPVQSSGDANQLLLHTETAPLPVGWSNTDTHKECIQKQDKSPITHSCCKDSGQITKTHTAAAETSTVHTHTHRVQKQPAVLSSVHTWLISSMHLEPHPPLTHRLVPSLRVAETHSCVWGGGDWRESCRKKLKTLEETNAAAAYEPDWVTQTAACRHTSPFYYWKWPWHWG